MWFGTVSHWCSRAANGFWASATLPNKRMEPTRRRVRPNMAAAARGSFATLSGFGEYQMRRNVSGAALCAVTLFSIVASTCASNWPPVVTDERDVGRLPQGQREIRCVDCDDAALEAIARRFQSLDYLYINDRSRITDRGIGALAHLSQLRQLEVGSAAMLTDVSIVVLKNLSALRELTLDGAALLSEASLITLTRDSKLNRFYFLHGPTISSEAMRLMRTQAPACDIRTS